MNRIHITESNTCILSTLNKVVQLHMIDFHNESSEIRGRFILKNFRFNTICNIIQEPKELQRYNCPCGFIDKSAVIKYHQLLSNVIIINGKSRFDQLATVSSSTLP